MHPQSPSLTIGRTVLKDSDGLHILRAAFDSKTTFENHLRLIFRAGFLRLCILMKSWRVFHYRLLFGRCFRGFVLVLDYCSAVWCSAANTYLKLLDREVNCAWFVTWGVFECNIAHRRSVAILCMLYRISWNPMHPLQGALPVPYVPVRVTCGALVAHRYVLMRRLAVEPHSTAGLSFPSQYLCGDTEPREYRVLLTLYLSVWDWLVLRALPILLHWS